MKHNERFFWLDVVRGLSAVAVFTSHLRAMLFVDYSKLQQTSLFQKLFYSVTGLGHQSVIVFFVLSGFFVGGSVIKKNKRFKWSDYAIARLSRLWIVLIPSLALTFLIDQIILINLPEVIEGTYYSIWNSGPNLNIPYSNSLLTFVGNLFFLQTIFTPVFGTNSPLWSLANEFWYYTIFPLFMYSIGKIYNIDKPSFILRFISGLILLILLFLLPFGIKQGFLIWILGIFVFVIYDKFLKFNYLFLVVGAAIFLGSLVYSKSINLQEIFKISSDLVIGFGFSVFCLSLVNLPNPFSKKSLLYKAFVGLSDVSYSLYLTHFPLVILIGALIYRSNKLIPDFKGFIFFFGWFLCLISFSIMFWFLFERNTKNIRELFLSVLSKG